MKTRTQSPQSGTPTPNLHSPVVVEESRNGAGVAPSENEIRERAHEKWVSAGCPECEGVKFWLEAEAELSS